MIKKGLELCLPIGLMIFSLSHIWDYYNEMSDFVRGFYEGLSLVFIIVGLIFFVQYMIKKISNCQITDKNS